MPSMPSAPSHPTPPPLAAPQPLAVAAPVGGADRFQAPASPWATKRNRDTSGIWAMIDIGQVEQRMRWFPPGGFVMGSAPGSSAAGSDEQAHPVELSRGFWLAEHECTQALWLAVMGSNPSLQPAPGRPVEQVNWDDCQDFIRRLNARIPGLQARLPSEAEWEYACRAGGSGPDPAVAAWCAEDGTGVHPIKHRGGGDWGLFDILGNVGEWCADGYRSDYQALPRRDPRVEAGDERVVELPICLGPRRGRRRDGMSCGPSACPPWASASRRTADRPQARPVRGGCAPEVRGSAFIVFSPRSGTFRATSSTPVTVTYRVQDLPVRSHHTGRPSKPADHRPLVHAAPARVGGFHGYARSSPC